MISGTGQNVENSSSGVALTGFLEIPSIAELSSGTEWNLKETMRYVFPSALSAGPRFLTPVIISVLISSAGSTQRDFIRLLLPYRSKRLKKL